LASIDKHSPVIFPLNPPQESANRPSGPGRIEGGLRVRGKFQKRSQPGKPLLSVITVVRNAREDIERAIQSVINQSYDNIEYIIMDGASTDGTIDIIRKYEDNIAYWMSELDNGLYDAMNKGVSLARGDWIYFLGSDDILLSNISNITTHLTNYNTIYYGDVYMPKLHKIYDGRFSTYKLMLRNICHQAIFYPTKVFEKYSYDLKYKIWADYVLNVKCYGDKDFDFVYIPTLVAVFNDEKGMSRNCVDPKVENDRKQIIRANFSTRYFLLYCVRSSLVRVSKRLGLKERLRSWMNKLIR